MANTKVGFLLNPKNIPNFDPNKRDGSPFALRKSLGYSNQNGLPVLRDMNIRINHIAPFVPFDDAEIAQLRHYANTLGTLKEVDMDEWNKQQLEASKPKTETASLEAETASSEVETASKPKAVAVKK